MARLMQCHRGRRREKPRLTRAKLQDIWRRSKFKTTQEPDGVLRTSFRFTAHAESFAALVEEIGGAVLELETTGIYHHAKCTKLPTTVRYRVPATVDDYIMRRIGLLDVEGVEADTWQGAPPFRAAPTRAW